MEYIYILLGFLVGFIIGLTGVGGGSLMTPALVLFFGIKPAIAIGTDLLYAAITKSGGIFIHQRNATIQWSIVGRLALGSIPASIGALFLLQKLSQSAIDYERLLTAILSVALILTALFLFIRVRQQASETPRKFLWLETLRTQYQIPMTMLSGAVIGLLVTLTSVGAGVIGAALLFFLYPRLKTISVVGTDLAHAVPITAIAGLGHANLGTVDFGLLGTLLLGSLPGIFLGGQVAVYIPEKLLRLALAWLLLIIGLRLIFSSIVG